MQHDTTGVLADWQIAEHCHHGMPMITPFVEAKTREIHGRRAVSYGCSSYGYDARLADEFRVPSPEVRVLDPHGMRDDMYETYHASTWDIQPGYMVLCRTVEYFRIPRNVLGLVFGKSTYARLGLVANVTPLEPGWQGTITLELSNTSHLPIRVHAHEGAVQVVFFSGDTPRQAYEGHYQRQQSVTIAKV